MILRAENNILYSYDEIKSLIESDLTNVFNQIKGSFMPNSKLFESINYSLDLTGKFKRPLLLYLSCLAINGCVDNLKYIAASIELMHSASLIHDDIIDEGIKRRGKESVYHKFGKTTAILTGDYLIFYAQKLISEMECDAKLVLGILSRLNNVYINMCIGLDLEESIVSQFEVNQSDYYKMIRYKTAEFFATVCEVGAIFAKGNDKQIKALCEFGMNLGMAYQIKDDLTSLIDSSSISDKTLETDMDRKLITLPLILAYQEASKIEKEVLRKQYTFGNEIQYEVIKKIILDTNTPNKINKIIEMYVTEALNALNMLEDNFYKDYLYMYAKSFL